MGDPVRCTLSRPSRWPTPGWRRLVLFRGLSAQRRFFVTSSHFILEKIDALPRSKWSVLAQHETWLLLLHGHARVGLLNAFPGEAVFLEDEETTVQAGALGMQALIAYEARQPDMMMLRQVGGSESDPAGIAAPPVAAAVSQLLSRSALEVRT